MLFEWVAHLVDERAQPAIIRGVPPHWVNEPHQELAPALMVVAGSFLPPPHQGLLLPRSLLLTSSLCREFGGSSTAFQFYSFFWCPESWHQCCIVFFVSFQTYLCICKLFWIITNLLQSVFCLGAMCVDQFSTRGCDLGVLKVAPSFCFMLRTRKSRF